MIRSWILSISFDVLKKLGHTLGALLVQLNDTVELIEVFVEIK